jgi:hypothetical protein
MKSLPTHVPGGERIFTNLRLLGAETRVTWYKHRSVLCSSAHAPWLAIWIELLQKLPFSVVEEIHRILWNEKRATVSYPKLNYSNPQLIIT